ncbi:MAG: energy transducer TonB [Sphingopyxis sp.]|nr:energy transducer TonB [Sphingopyxis sp.]
MTLIPLISAIWTAPQATTAPAGAVRLTVAGRYGNDRRLHPVAALFAAGVPVALLVAVALSPMTVIVPPKSSPLRGTLIEVEKPVDPTPETRADTKAKMRPRAATETVDPLLSVPVRDNAAATGSTLPDTIVTGFDEIVTPPADPPPLPKLVFAELDPRYAGVFQPDYPASEQRREIEGVARVRVLIGTDGRVKAVELVSTDSPGFFAETKRRALAKGRFKPATRGGIAEESWKTMTVRFEIKGA